MPQPFASDRPAVSARPTGTGRFQTELAVAGRTIIADEPVEVGGLASGPTPYELLGASLAACTVMTMLLYAERKGWELPPFEVSVVHVPPSPQSPRDRFRRVIHIDAPLDDERRARLFEIANRCPVHRTLERGFDIDTELGDRAGSGDTSAQHMIDMEEVCAT